MFNERTMGWGRRAGGAAWTGAIVLTLSAFGGVSVQAAIIRVPDEQPNIQAAIDVAEDGDVIVLDDLVFTGVGNKNVLFLGKAITLRSESGNRDACIIDCENVGRFAKFVDGDTAVIWGITIANGALDGGAAILNAGSDPTFEDCIVQDCNVGFGGAFDLVAGSSLTISGSTFRRNTATFDGGVIHAASASLVVVESEFLDNMAQRGGGIFATVGGTVTVTDCDFTNNEASTGGGGGMRVSASVRLTCTDSSFDGNCCSNNGGGLRVGNPDPASRISGCNFTGNAAPNNSGGGASFSGTWDELISSCVFEGNSAYYGGGAAVAGSPSVGFLNCLFAGNEVIGFADGAPPASGGLDVYASSTATLINCTFTDNSSDEFGGAITASGLGHAILINCVMWVDQAPTGSEIHLGYPNDDPGAVTVSYSDVAGGEAGVTIDKGSTLNWGEGNIDADPLFDEHKRLSAGSPAIDAADTTAVPKGVTDDIDGRPRFVDDPDTKDTGNGDPPLDMGAHEFQTCPADLDRDESVGFGDILAILAAWGPYEPCPPARPEDIDHDCQVGFSDILIVLGAWGPCE